MKKIVIIILVFIIFIIGSYSVILLNKYSNNNNKNDNSYIVEPLISYKLPDGKIADVPMSESKTFEDNNKSIPFKKYVSFDTPEGIIDVLPESANKFWNDNREKGVKIRIFTKPNSQTLADLLGFLVQIQPTYRTFKLNGKIGDVPVENAAAFLKEYPNAEEMIVFQFDGEMVVIPAKNAWAFLKENPTAKPFYYDLNGQFSLVYEPILFYKFKDEEVKVPLSNMNEFEEKLEGELFSKNIKFRNDIDTILVSINKLNLFIKENKDKGYKPFSVITKKTNSISLDPIITYNIDGQIFSIPFSKSKEFENSQKNKYRNYTKSIPFVLAGKVYNISFDKAALFWVNNKTKGAKLITIMKDVCKEKYIKRLYYTLYDIGYSSRKIITEGVFKLAIKEDNIFRDEIYKLLKDNVSGFSKTKSEFKNAIFNQ